MVIIEMVIIETGAPQASILDPQLFLIYDLH